MWHKQRESGRALCGSSVARRVIRRTVSDIAAGRMRAGAGANASGACARGLLSGTLSVILPYLLCQIAGLLFAL